MDTISTSAQRRRHVTLTLIWFLSALSIAIIAPGISDIISVVGSLSAFFILVFPGLILLKLNLEKNLFLVGIGVLLIVFGIWIFGLTLTLTVLEVMKEWKTKINYLFVQILNFHFFRLINHFDLITSLIRHLKNYSSSFSFVISP